MSIKIIKIKSRHLPSANFNISKSFLEEVEYDETCGDQINVSKETRNEIKKFGEIFLLLKGEGVIKRGML